MKNELPSTGKSLCSAGLVLVAAMIVVSYLWGTAFTCNDDLWTSTAWLRWGGGFTGWQAILHASWVQSVDQGRFYDLFAYTLTQLPYTFHSIEAAAICRIGCMLLVFFGFALMLASLFRDLRLALYFAVLPVALLETKYAYNPFHAYPLWFNLALGLLFLAVAAFNESLLRHSRGLWLAAIAACFCTFLLYESFLLYLVFFYAIAYRHTGPESGRLSAHLRKSIKAMSGLLAAAALYLVLYGLFARAHPTNYPGTSLSLAAPGEILYTILQFSISGLNFTPLLHFVREWNARAACVAAVVCAVSFSGFRRYASQIPAAAISALMAAGIAGMLLPNVLYGFSERYRNWAAHIGNFYLGSFDSAFGEALFIGAALLLIVRCAGRWRITTLAAGLLAAVLAVAAYANVCETARFFRVHQENRQAWRLVDAILSSNRGGLAGPAAVVIAPSLVHLPMLETGGVYDYWSYYFTGKLAFPVRVIGDPGEYVLLPQELRRAPLFGMRWIYAGELHGAVAALGPLDIAAWRDNPARLVVSHAIVAEVRKQVVISEHGPLDLSRLSLR